MTILAITLAPWPVIAVRLGLIAAGIIAWYWTQSVLGKRVPKVANEVWDPLESTCRHASLSIL